MNGEIASSPALLAMTAEGEEKLFYDKTKKKGSLLSAIIAFTPCSGF
jgi:hypothetical protein